MIWTLKRRSKFKLYSMPLIWKRYYWRSIYMLLYNLAATGLMVYIAINDRTDITEYMIAAIPGIMIYKPLLNLRLINHLKKATGYQTDEGYFFIMFFTLNIIYALIILTISVGVLTQWNRDMNKVTLLAMFSTGMLYTTTSIYIAIYDLPLKKLVNTQLRKEVETIGQEPPIIN